MQDLLLLENVNDSSAVFPEEVSFIHLVLLGCALIFKNELLQSCLEALCT